MTINSFQQICSFDKKSDLKAFCKTVTVKMDEFVSFILTCEGGLLPWHHQIHHRDFVPEHLRPGAAVPGTTVEKHMRRLEQIFAQHRQLVGHLFYTPELSNWHLIYFDQRDINQRQNHWVGGSHMHIINWLWPERDCQTEWERFRSGNIQMKGALHVKFERAGH